MDGTEEGMALAQAAREAAAERKRALEENQGRDKPKAPAAKRANVAPRVVPPCMHEVAVPHGFDISSIKLDPAVYGTLEQPALRGPRAKVYPFTLDPFQETAVACLERKESVLVAAHTSAGKTAVAEYAIAMSFRDKQRVVYTSPLKALSNQKFRELAEEFTDVGLMTGDVCINPNASCVVMTTEILRSMIYRGSELLREVAWVIFDEVHYMQDRERGVVWEETIIFMPQGARMVFLSATLSNASEFAGWVSSLHHTPCHVVYTDYRPTPLQHYAYATGASGLHLILDDKGNFRKDNFRKVRAMFEIDGPANGAENGDANGSGNADRQASGAGASVSGRGGAAAGTGRAGRGGGAGGATGAADSGGNAAGRGAGRWDRGRGGRGRGGRGGRGGAADLEKKKSEMKDQVSSILHVIKRLEWTPVIFFSFARKECEQLAGSLMPRNKDGVEGAKDGQGQNFNTPEEAQAVEYVYKAAIQCLSEGDQGLRAVENMLPMLMRGIGVHHSGLLPLLKEVVEVLFSDGLIKVLFTTETFAMGLNMPARTVVFTQLRKFDGTEMRLLTSGEYIQMSGRAGRRGKDDKGIVIQMVTDDLDEEQAMAMCLGKPSPLVSSFKLSYYTMLNMLKRTEGGEEAMENVIRKSFQQYSCERQLPLLEAELKRLEQEQAKLTAEGAAEIDEYQQLRTEIAKHRASLSQIVMQPPHSLMFLRPGRLVRVEVPCSSVPGATIDWGWGVLVNVNRKAVAGPVVTDGSSTDKADGSQAGQSVKVDSSVCYTADVLVVLDSASVQANNPVAAHPSAPGAEMQVVPCALSVMSAMSAARLPLPANLLAADARRAVMLQLQELLRQYPDGPPLLDPIEDMNITDNPELSRSIDKIHELEQQMANNPVFQAERDDVKFKLYADKANLDERVLAIRKQLKDSQLQKFRAEVKERTAVLKRLGHLNDEGVVTLKGRAACEVDTADELLTTELMFHNAFLGLSHAQLVALVSCLIPVEKSIEQIKLMTPMSESLALLQSSARHIAEVSAECKLQVDPDVYVESFQPFLMDIMYEWSKGATFAHICSMTDIYEGSIIRAARRLDELLQQMTTAARVIGSEDLAKHIEAANLTIRRDIIFAASLYI